MLLAIITEQHEALKIGCLIVFNDGHSLRHAMRCTILSRTLEPATTGRDGVQGIGYYGPKAT